MLEGIREVFDGSGSDSVNATAAEAMNHEKAEGINEKQDTEEQHLEYRG
jgi:hypothetical protein